MKLRLLVQGRLQSEILKNIFRKIQQKSFREVQMELTDVQRNLQ